VQALVRETTEPLSEMKKYDSIVVCENIFQRRDYAGFIFLSILNLLVLGLLAWHWFSWSDLIRYPIIYTGLTLLFLVKIVINQGRWYILPSMKKPRPLECKDGWRVAVVTTIVPGAESLEMLDRTVQALVRLDYPHDTWVLDEGDDPQVKALCGSLGAKHFSRKDRPEYQTASGTFQSFTKHGNYNAWLTDIGFERYDIVATFDADHVPDPSMLSTVLGYFNNEEVGYVQLPQLYYNKQASFIARGAAEETYAYNACTQSTAFALNHPIIIGGHCTHRVEALREFGGLGAHAADDLLTTLLYRSRGWRGIYVRRVVAQGLTPVNWSIYLKQQLRWARSVLDIKLNYYPKFASNLPVPERILRFLHGLNYVEGGLTTFGFLLILAVMLATGIVPTVISPRLVVILALLGIVWLMSELFRQRFYLDRKTENGVPWRALLVRYAKWPYMFWAFCSFFPQREVRYILTPKSRLKNHRVISLWPHLIVVLVIVTSWMLGFVRDRKTPTLLAVLSIVIILVSIALVWSEFLSYPDPYDSALFPTKVEPPNA
jgi:cellulose synthase (UDP-forming)